jgi:carboxymethylenebutenolidase
MSTEGRTMGEMIEFAANGGTCPGYLAKSEIADAPGVVVLQEWWGISGAKSDIKEIAERFAAAGYTALAPDLYHGVATEEPDEAGKLLMALSVPQASKDMRGAIEHLRGLTGKPVGTVGFCMGGALSLYAACENPEGVAACVDFYGGHPAIKPDLAALKAPLLGLFAERDGFVSPQVVKALDEQLTTLGKAHEFTIYPGADHAFFNSHRPEIHDPEASADAWRRMLAWFGQYLGFTEAQLNSDEQLKAGIDEGSAG